MTTKGRYNIRAYGIYINAEKKVLVSDEFRMGMLMTKFPGGGLEVGEGIIDALKREWMEELGLEIEIVKHFYTTDFYIQSAFHEVQLISVYYLVEPKQEASIPVSEQAFDFPEKMEGAQSFRWIPLNHLQEDTFTFPIDKKVAEMLAEHN